MLWRRSVIAVAVVGLLTAVTPAAVGSGSYNPISVQVEPYATLRSDGGLSFRAYVRCGPLPGTPDFREAIAGAFQPRTGAEGEGGLGPDIVCDGRWRVYTASVGPITDARFRPGTANASANVIACNTWRDKQVCAQASQTRQVRVQR